MIGVYILTPSLLLIVFISIALFHLVEKKHFNKHLNKEGNIEDIEPIKSLFNSQSVKSLSIIFLSFLIIGLYDWQLKTLQNQVIKLKSKQEITNISYNEAIDELQTYKKQYDELLNKYKTIIDGKVSTNNTHNNNTTVKVADNKPKQPDIQDIFGQDSNGYSELSENDKIKTSIDKVKIYYEELLVTHFFLKKCGKTNDDNYNLIFRALQKDLQSLNTSFDIQNDILTAAVGSYQELYSENECLPDTVNGIYKQYNEYMKDISNMLKTTKK
ncbi:MAG: hypothetical protein R3D71_07465 [Rickettsiales bacterium]